MIATLRLGLSVKRWQDLETSISGFGVGLKWFKTGTSSDPCVALGGSMTPLHLVFSWIHWKE